MKKLKPDLVTFTVCCELDGDPEFSISRRELEQYIRAQLLRGAADYDDQAAPSPIERVLSVKIVRGDRWRP